MSGTVYFLGEREGEDIKIGWTKQPVGARVKGVNAEQTTSASYVLLAAIPATRTAEAAAKRHFTQLARTDKGRKTEYFRPDDELVEYVNWLRSQWWTALDETDDVPHIEPDIWLPDNNGRRIKPPLANEGLIVQPYEALDGPLAGTAWKWMVGQKAGIQDYFTPPEIVDAARAAMGGIDLDAASHWLANRVHKIPDWFHTGRSAFENRWHDRVWLNPPYSNNAPWFEQIIRYVGSGDVEQLCMISPVWAFTTNIARDVMELVSATVLLSPTPKFWGNSKGLTGVNHPHMVIYIGERQREFLDAFAPFGIPVEMAWDKITPFEPTGEADAKAN